jgi:hypothetical protein
MKKYLSFFIIGFFACASLFAVSTDVCYDLADAGFYSHADGADTSTTIVDLFSHTVTAVGNAQLDTTTKWAGTASVQLDGTGDYFTIPDGAYIDFGTGDFTIEGRFNFNSHIAQIYIYSRDNGATNNGSDLIWFTDNSLCFYMNGVQVTCGTLAISDGTWYHLEVSRNGTNVRIFVNGTQTGSTGSSSADINYTTPFSWGAFDFAGGLTPLNGYIDEPRIIKGVALHTSNFTPSTVPYTDCAAGGTKKLALLGVG